MSFSRAFSSLLAAVCLASSSIAHAQFGIVPIPDQTIPSGKTLVVPIPATDPNGPPRTYFVAVGPATVSGSPSVPASEAGVTGAIRTGDPHFVLGVSYTDSNNIQQTGTMEFQMLREFAPTATQIIGGLTQAGFYSPTGSGTNTNFLQFFRIVPGFIIQGGAPTNDSSFVPGFSFESEYNSALIFSGSEGQLAMANSNNATSVSGLVSDGNSNGSQFFITLSSDRADLDYGYTIFGQMLRGFDTLEGIGSTPFVTDTNGNQVPGTPVNITSATIAQNDTDAVLLLSATGVCDAAVTVIATSGTEQVYQSFMAHAVADSFSDPPFLRPPPNVTAPNGTLKVPIQATDLQLDLLRYGYQRALPAVDQSIVTGTSPVLSVPLISNAANTVSAGVDSFVASSRGYARFPFRVGANDKPLRGALVPIASGTGGSLVVSNTTLATFTSGNTKDTLAGFTASVNWGDGVVLSGTQVHIVKGTGRTIHKFDLVAGHTYSAPGQFPLIVTISDSGGATLALTGTVNVSPSNIAISGTDIYRTGGVLTNQPVATFADKTDPVTPNDYSATIDWGDGSVSPGTIATIPTSGYRVLGTHTYQTPNTFTVSTVVTRTGSNGYSASEWSAAHIAGINAPQIFPPFPQAHLAQIWSEIGIDVPTVTGSIDGGNPIGTLVRGADGNFYGTTGTGGASGYGTVYQISSSGSFTTLYNFTGQGDGGNPAAGLVQGNDGNFYGTTVDGGLISVSDTSNGPGSGTIFQISPTGSLNTIYSFTGGSDGGNPMAPLFSGSGNILYGTAFSAGSGGHGTLFSVTTSGAFTVLYAFTSSGNDGGHPQAGVITGTDGNLYGTCNVGGDISKGSEGTVFRYSFTSGSAETIHTFSGVADGGNPQAGLVSGTDGNFYGTTGGGGIGGNGVVYKISLDGSSFNTVYSFNGGSDGAKPDAPLITGSDGNFYGTASINGTNGGSGTIFQLTPAGVFTTLYTFTGGNDGGDPQTALATGTDAHSFYGTALNGGADGFGTVFQLVTSGSLDTTGSFTLLHSFAENDGLQVGLRCSVAIVNSGNKPSMPGSFAVYVDSAGQLDGNQTQFVRTDGVSSFPIPTLNPGQSTIFSFRLEGSVIDTRLKLPVGFLPSASEPIIGVVTYDDPVANFDGSIKIISPASFPSNF